MYVIELLGYTVYLSVNVTEKYVCSVCGYVYNPFEGDVDSGVTPGTSFEDLPDDWVCPICGALKDQFEKQLN